MGTVGGGGAKERREGRERGSGRVVITVVSFHLAIEHKLTIDVCTTPAQRVNGYRTHTHTFTMLSPTPPHQLTLILAKCPNSWSVVKKKPSPD